MERAEIPQRFAVISLCASPINRPAAGARAEARRQVPGLSQPPDRPSRQPIPACRRRLRRLLLPQPVTLPMWCEVSDSRIPAREQGLGAAIVCSNLSPSCPGSGPCTLSTRSSCSSSQLSILSNPQKRICSRGTSQMHVRQFECWYFGNHRKWARGLIRWRNLTS